MKLKKEELEKLSTKELIDVLKNCISQEEKDFVFDILDEKRHKATQKIVK